MATILCAIGIIINTVGTLITLWKIFATKSSYVGTVAWYDNQSEEFPKEKRCVYVGFSLIVLGNILQIISLFI